MKVILRTVSGNNSMKVKEDKIVVLLNWIREFRFIDIKIASRLLDANNSNTARLIKSLVKDGYLIYFKNVSVSHKLIALTQHGINFLKEHRLAEFDEVVFEYARYKKTLSLFHHLTLQEYLLKDIKEYSEIIWEYNLENETYKPGSIRPDCVVTYKNSNIKVAVEYERWVKTKARVYYKFYSHLENIQKGLYAGVLYAFEDNIDHKTYVRLFNESVWPRYKMERSKSGNLKLVKLKKNFDAASVRGLQSVFDFRLVCNLS